MTRLKRFKHQTTALFLICCVFISFSCTRKSDEVTNKDEGRAKATNVSGLKGDFNESPRDLQDVDYKQFYDELSPHGKWAQVKSKDLGIDINKQGSPAGEKQSGTLLYDLLGVNTAYANEEVDFGMFFVWQPSPDLYVSVAAGEPYVPYTDGRWVYSDYGWYYNAPTPCEEITHHYGRWAYTDDLGWVWLPGRVWAPAWVSWRDDDDYIAWSPLGPESCFIDDEFYYPELTYIPERYVFVESTHFCDDEPYRWMHRDFDDPEHFRHLERRDGLVIVNNTIVNRGPDIRSIEKVTGKHFDMVQVNKVNNINDIRNSDGRINTFAPSLQKVNNNGKLNRQPVSSPKDFKQFSEVRSEKQNSGGNNNPGGVNDKNNGATRLDKNKPSNKHSPVTDMNKKRTNKQGNDKQYSGVQKYRKNNGKTKNNSDNSRGYDKQQRSKQNYGNINRRGNDNNSGYNNPNGRQKDGRQKQGNSNNNANDRSKQRDNSRSNEKNSNGNQKGNERNNGNNNSESKQHGKR